MQLKPCPFCGAHKAKSHHIDTTLCWFIDCPCGASVASQASEHDCVKRWNRRPKSAKSKADQKEAEPNPRLITKILAVLDDMIEVDEELRLARKQMDVREALFRALIAMAAEVLCGEEEQETIVWQKVTLAADQARDWMLTAWRSGKAERN